MDFQSVRLTSDGVTKEPGPMSRSPVSFSMFLVFSAISLGAVVSAVLVGFGIATPQAFGVPDPGNGERAQKDDQKLIQQLKSKLARPVNLDKGIDPSTPLKDALEFLSDRYDLTILIDTKAFEQIDIQKVEEQPVQLPRMVGVSMSTVLRLLLKQLQSDRGSGTYILKRDFILILPTPHATPAEWHSIDRRQIVTVDVDFDRSPLDEALRHLADSSGINIVLDARAGDKGRKPVTANMNDVPVDTAVRLLAEMADLKSLAIDNVLFVTTRESAKELQEEQAQRTKKTEARKPAELGENPLIAPKEEEKKPKEMPKEEKP